MYSQDVLDEMIRLSAELKERSRQARAESARLVAKSKKLVTEMARPRHATDDPGQLERSRPQDRPTGLPPRQATSP